MCHMCLNHHPGFMMHYLSLDSPRNKLWDKDLEMIPESTEKSMENETDGKAAHQRCISKQVTTVDNSFILLEIWEVVEIGFNWR